MKESIPLELAPSFGFGDRMGLATPGHLAAMQDHGGNIQPIYAQQSIREMARTGRSPDAVMQAARDALVDADFQSDWGSDADHLKTPEDVNVTAAAGFVFFTIDPSDHVVTDADDYTPAQLELRYQEAPHPVPWIDRYHGETIRIGDDVVIEFDHLSVTRAAVKYGRAIEHALAMAQHIDSVMNGMRKAYEIELSVDETPQPTTLAEHYIIADQCMRADMKLVSLAPRYIGDFEKGIDYKGSTSDFETSLAQHAAIARHLGPYKLSLHSGSDKLSIYEPFARITQGMFHVKTAGTSYLEALRVVARENAVAFRDIVDFSRERFDEDRATYHISATLDAVAPPADIADNGDIERLYLDEDDGRQVLHVTFGSVLTHDLHGKTVRDTLIAHPQTHGDVLASHLGKHLAELNRGLCDGSTHTA